MLTGEYTRRDSAGDDAFRLFLDFARQRNEARAGVGQKIIGTIVEAERAALRYHRGRAADIDRATLNCDVGGDGGQAVGGRQRAWR